MSELMKVSVTDTHIIIQGVKIPIPAHAPDLVVTEAILLVRSIGIDEDGSSYDAMDYYSSQSTTHITRLGLLHNALEWETEGIHMVSMDEEED